MTRRLTSRQDLPDDVVWVPGNNGVNLRELGLGHGSVTTATSGDDA